VSGDNPTTLHPAWLEKPSVQTLIRVCAEQDIPIRFVGGCVRDTLMNRSAHDIDVATPISPDVIAETFERLGFSVPNEGKAMAHGRVRVVVKGEPFEITTLRIDKQCDGRHAEVAFTEDWKQDAERRDFTMNALSLTPDGQLYDYTGGVADATAGEVRFIRDAAERIQEDSLRILRFFRFQATHGQGEPELTALEACQQAAEQGKLHGLSVERIASEMEKLLAAPDPLQSLSLMHQYKVLQALCPDTKPALEHMQRLIQTEQDAGMTPDPWVRLVVLYPEKAQELAEQWKLSNDTKSTITKLATLPEIPTEQGVREAVYKDGNAIASGVVLRDAASGKQENAAELLKVATQFEKPIFPVNGADLIALGMISGRELGKKKDQLEKVWIESGFTASNEKLLAEL
jgi:poly(A) polymerase